MNEPRWLDAREDKVWRRYEQMRTQLAVALNRQLTRDSGLSLADYEVLVHLSESPSGRLRMFELGRALQWEKSRVSHHVRRMQGRGLVDREECETDGRGAFIVITPVGRAAIGEAAPGHLAAVRRYLVDALSPAQLEALGDIAAIVLERLAEDDAATVPLAS